MTLATRILVGLGFGIAVGVFFGDRAELLSPLAEIYIRLMQMTVLPYLITSLVVAFGQLTPGDVSRLARLGLGMLTIIWLVTALVIAILPLGFPDIESAAFFSHSLIEPRQSFSLTDIYFAPNPFAALSNNVVPAVVLFSSLLGISLINVARKEALLEPLRIWNEAVLGLTRYIINLTPIGVFAIASVAAGTIMPETLQRLEAYLVVYVAGALLLAFWILPTLVSAVTPFGYQEIAGISRSALLTAFVTGNALIVLPVLIEQTRVLLRKHHQLSGTTNAAPNVLIPVLFNFPAAGKLLSLLFVPFAAWMSGAALQPTELVELFSAGIPSYFAKAQTALPYLLDVLALPHDLLQFYIPTTIITGKFDALVTAVNLLMFALVGSAAMGGFLVMELNRLLVAALQIALGTALTGIVCWGLLQLTIDTAYRGDEVIRAMHRAAQQMPVSVVNRLADAGVPEPGRPLSFSELRTRGTLRIGFDPNNLPMSFYNRDGELVGYEVELAVHLAESLALRPQFVPVTWPELPSLLAKGEVDVMPGVWYRPHWFGQIRLTEPYFSATVALVMLDERRHAYDTIEKLRASRGLRIGVPLAHDQIRTSMDYYFAGAEVEFTVVEFWDAFFKGKYPELDAFMMPAQHAAGWTLLHPQYSVVVPQPNPVELPTAFAVAMQANELADLIDQWAVFAKQAGVVDVGYRYWIMGQGAAAQQRRWSVARNVLGWPI